VVTEESSVANTFKNFFDNAVNSLNLQCDSQFISETSHLSNPIEVAVEKFKEHPSIIAIRNNVSFESEFDFCDITIDDMEKEIANLDSKKSGVIGGIPSKYLKLSTGVSSNFLTEVWRNEVLAQNIFPEKLKLADVNPIHKKGDSTCVNNFRPVSVLPSVSKVFERFMQKQINAHINCFLSKYLCGYRKGFNTQTALLSLIEQWRSILDAKGFAGAILMDLSKAFDTINHELLIAKLHAYGFSRSALTLIFSYLSNRWQHIKVDTSFSDWSEILKGVPPGSVLGPLLFNIYLNDLFFMLSETNVCNFADDTTPYVCDKSLKNVLEKLEQNSEIAISWFKTNYMKLNTDKCHLLISGHKYETVWAKVGNDKI